MVQPARWLRIFALLALVLAVVGLFRSREELQQNLAVSGLDLMQRDLKIRRLEGELEASRVYATTLEKSLRDIRSVSDQSALSQPVPVVKAPAVLAESPRGSKMPAERRPENSTARIPPAEQTERVRDYFAGQLEEAWRAGEIEDAERDEILGLLMKIRSLKGTRSAGDEELIRVQEEFIEVTGVGVGEFLVELDDSIERSRRPEDALPIEEGEGRKRFADELSRKLGIAEGGEDERFEDGKWQASAP